MKSNGANIFSALVALWIALPLFGDVSAPDNSTQDFPRLVPYEFGTSDFAPGDSIKIEEVRGTTSDIEPGGTYCVTGRYTLSSQDEADLSLFATTTNRVLTPFDPKQTMRVKKGPGSFRLIKKMTEDGYLHLSFYSRATGQGFGGVYFGQGQWVLRDKYFSYHAAASRLKNPNNREPVSSVGPNHVLFGYLGNPVAVPANLDPAYSKEGLTDAMQTAARNSSISLVKLEIDDSEFPFLIGTVFASKADKTKFIEQIKNLPGYATTGGVGGETSYAMNLVPDRAFPMEASQRIHHRMILREAVLNDKINETQ